MIKNRTKQQTYNDGAVRIYETENAAAPGKTPRAKLKKKFMLRYSERRLGLQRYYSELQAQVVVSRVIRCPAVDISTQDIAITEDGKQFRISLIQVVPEVMPPAMDLTLARQEQIYEVVEDEMA